MADLHQLGIDLDGVVAKLTRYVERWGWLRAERVFLCEFDHHPGCACICGWEEEPGGPPAAAAPEPPP